MTEIELSELALGMPFGRSSTSYGRAPCLQRFGRRATGGAATAPRAVYRGVAPSAR
jgi:hypothetical protein